MSYKPHIINRITLDLDTGQMADIWSLQEDLSNLIWQKARPQMETLFDRLIPENEVVRLDRVSVEIPLLDRQFLADEFLSNLLSALEQTLTDYLAGYRPPEVTASREKCDRAIADWEIFLYFLRCGRLPWWSAVASRENHLTRWQTALQSDRSWQAPFRELLASHPQVNRRLIRQFSEPFRHQIILQLQPSWLSWRSLLSRARQLAAELNLSPRSVEFLDRRAWDLIFAILSQSNASEPLPAAAWIHQWLRQLFISLQQEKTSEIFPTHDPFSPVTSWIQFLEPLIAAMPTTDRSPWQTALKQILSDSNFPGRSDLPPPAENDSNHPELSNRDRRFHHPPGDTIQKSARKQFSGIETSLDPEETAAGLYLNQAGLVLLHSFLKPYFQDVGLLENDHFQDSTSQQTAIYLLYYLATRQTDPPEYELVLPKLLCGWPLNEPVGGSIELPETALNEAENLLQVAIDYWQVLKSTSPDGLREGFLQREGRLTRIDLGWKLRVEQQAIDILLSRLPWGIGMVKLSWMDELLTVEWI